MFQSNLIQFLQEHENLSYRVGFTKVRVGIFRNSFWNSVNTGKNFRIWTLYKSPAISSANKIGETC